MINTAELKRLVTLGTPIVLAQLFMMAMHVTDALMAGRYAAEDLAGIALALSAMIPIIMFITGALTAVTPIVAQLFGAGREREIGHVGRQSIYFALAAGCLAFVLITIVRPFIYMLDAEPAVARVSVGYLEAVRWGYPGLAAYTVLRSVCEGLGRTRPAMVIAGSLLGVNALLNYAFIYGAFGAPELGGIGCGVATAIVMWLNVALILIVVTRRFYARIELFRGDWRIDLSEWLRLARLGMPIGTLLFFEIGVYSLVTLLLPPFGTASIAAHSIAMNINGVAFMVPLALGMAASIRVGHCVGGEDYEGARIAGQTALRACFIYAAIAALVLYLTRMYLVSAYNELAEVREIAATLLVFVAAYQFVDDTQATALGVQRGYKDTRVPMWFALAGYWAIGLPVGCAAAYGWFGLPALGVYGFWIGLTAGLAFVAVTVNARRIRFATDVDRIKRYAQDEKPGDAEPRRQIVDPEQVPEA